MHPEKSKIVYCKDSKRTGFWPNEQFTFLGFTFRPRRARDRKLRIFTSFLPAVSDEALKRMRHTVRGWRMQSQTPATLAELAEQCNSTIRGWLNYYGSFYQSAMHKLFRYIDSRLEKWARRKYKTLWRNKRRSEQWLSRLKNETPHMFAHWRVAGNGVG